MSMGINTNITSMIGQQNLSESKSALTTSMERLSSGLRINSAKDDAAGQAIANRMTSQITGLSQAQRNANDGISVAQTAEGALNQVNDNLQRVRELTVQAQNGTNSQADLNSIQDEITQRLSEVDRISAQTDFNGTKVLDGSVTSIDIQVGADDGQNITIDLQNMDSSSLNLDGFNVNDTVEVTDTTALTASQSLVSYTDPNGDTAYAVEDTGTATTTYVTASSTNAGVVTATGTDVTADVTSTTAVATGDMISSPGTSTATPLSTLDNALSQVDNMRSDLGAVQNRFDSAITNLSTTETNISAARSRIEDADYATEVADMTKNQILQQAGTSVLAQANQLPQSVLSLLG